MIKTDYHVHIGYDSNRFNFGLNEEEVIKDMKKYGISKSVIFSFPNITPSEKDPYKEENEKIKNISKKFNCLIPFMFVHPYRDSLSQLKKNSKNFRGYKLHSHAKDMKYQYPNIANLETMKYLIQTRKPFLFHTGLQEGERGRDIVKFIEQTSSPVIVAHASRLYKEDLKMLSNLPNAYIDLSPLRTLIENPLFIAPDFKFTDNLKNNYEKIIDFLAPLFNKRMLWGSDKPWPENFGSEKFEGELSVYEYFKPFLGELIL